MLAVGMPVLLAVRWEEVDEFREASFDSGRQVGK